MKRYRHIQDQACTDMKESTDGPYMLYDDVLEFAEAANDLFRVLIDIEGEPLDYRTKVAMDKLSPYFRHFEPRSKP